MIPIGQTAVTNSRSRLDLANVRAVRTSLNRAMFGMDAASWKAIMEQAWLVVGKYWYEKILPKHFTEQGAQEYGYRKRANKYEKRKERYARKVFGTTPRPLMYTGQLKQMVMSILNVKSLKSGKGSTVKLHGPPYMYMRGRGGTGPDKARELRAISTKDKRMLKDILDEEIRRIIRQDRQSIDIVKGHRT